ncbi:MAG: hypothetical protein HY535_04420 [Chloroflexi bacterium]|nr:hypothetical protein [Chloroflexota bacterium]
MEDIISMADMALVFEVTDALGIDRELVRVELTKEDPGSVARGPEGMVEIVLPLTVPVESWLPKLKERLEVMGFGVGEPSQ